MGLNFGSLEIRKLSFEYLLAHPFLSLAIDSVQEQMAIGSADGKVSVIK